MKVTLTIVVRAKGKNPPDWGLGSGILSRTEFTWPKDISESDFDQPAMKNEIRRLFREVVEDTVETEIESIEWGEDEE